MDDNTPNKHNENEDDEEIKKENKTKVSFMDKYRDQLQNVDYVKEIERLKSKINRDLQKYNNLNSEKPQMDNQKEKDKAKEIDFEEMMKKYGLGQVKGISKNDNNNTGMHDKKKMNDDNSDDSNDDRIGEIAKNIVNKVAMKINQKAQQNEVKEEKNNDEIKDKEERDSDGEEKELNDYEDNKPEEAVNKLHMKSIQTLTDESEEENNIQRDNTNQHNTKENNDKLQCSDEQPLDNDEPIQISELQSEHPTQNVLLTPYTKDIRNQPNQIDKTPSNISNIEEPHQRSQPKALASNSHSNSNQKENNQFETSNNSNVFSASQLNQKFQSQIKMIEEKSETNRLEQEQNLKELKELESQLPINQRLTNENREIRKNACKEITEMCTEEFSEEERNEFFECFNPWVKYCIEETNAYVLPESLNFFIVFHITFPDFKANSLNDFFDNLERIASFGMNSLNDLCYKIITMYIKDKRFFNQTFTELMKGLNKASVRLSKYLSDIMSDMIMKGVFGENYIKIIFEKVIHMYSSINAKTSEKKKMNGKLIELIYSIIEDDLTTICKCVHLTSQTQFNNLLSKVKKSTEIKYRLYPEDLNNVSQMGNAINKTNQGVKNKGQQEISHEKQTQAVTENNNIPSQIDISSEVNDLCSIIPSAFFEFNLLTQYAQKMTLLEEVNNILSKVKEVKDREKNYLDIYKTLHYCIEESNILIHLEGIKIFGHIARLLQSEINTQKTKSILETSFEKFKDKKSLVKSELFNLFDIIIDNDCLSIDAFIVLVLQFCFNNNQKKAVPIVKQGVLEYLKQMLKEINPSMIEKCYLTYAKYLVDIIGSESQSNIKDLCTDLLLIFKGKTKSRENIAQFNELTKNLPNYRKNILTKDKNDYCTSENNTDYKKNLKKIKSNISFSSKSISKEKKINSSFRKDTSTPKNNPINSQKMLNRNVMKKTPSSNDMLKGKNNKQDITNIRLVNNKNDQHDNDDDNEENEMIINKPSEITFKPNEAKRKKVEEDKKVIKEDQDSNTETQDSKNNKKKEFLEQRKDDVVNHISALNKKGLEDYLKAIVRDFLYFVNKVSCGKLKDNLSNHFNVIFNILGKILERMLYLNGYNENTELTESVSNQISDDLINRIIKVVIILPCINQVEGSTPFDPEVFNSFIASIKQAATCEEKFFIYLLVNLIKFANKGNNFLESIDPKPSIIFFLDYISLCNVQCEKVHSMMNEFVDETESLTREEKMKYLTIKGVSPISSREMTQNIDDNIEEERDVQHINNNIIIHHDNKPNEEEDFLLKKARETEELIRIKHEENERLKEKVRQHEEKKKQTENEQLLSVITSMHNTNNPKTMVSATLPQNTFSGDIINKLIEENKDRIISNIKSINTDDQHKITERLKMTTKKFDLTIKGMVEKIEQKDSTAREQIINQMKQIPLSTPVKNIRNLEDCFNEEQEQSEIQNSINQTPFHNDSNSIQNIFAVQKESPSSNFKKLINKLISTLEENNQSFNIEELFHQLTQSFRQLPSGQLKLEYTEYLKETLINPPLLKQTSINLYLQLYDYILNILSSEILLDKKNQEKSIAHLQYIVENLKNYRRMTEVLKMMVFLLRKYFPKNLNHKISDVALIILKVIAYLIKELIKLLSTNPVEPKDIIGEINELFTITPPDTLKQSTFNYKLYKEIFTVLKALTDEIFFKNKEKFREMIEYLMNNKITNKTYMEYLVNLSQKD